MSEPRAQQQAGRRWALSIALIVVASIIGFVSIFSTWVKRQALETDTWTNTSSKFLQNEAIRSAVADFAVAQLYENVDVEAEIAAQLPRDLQGLAGPAAVGLRQVARESARTLLAEPGVQRTWEDANRVAHEQLVALIEHRGEFVSTTDGVVTLDLRGIVSDIAAEIGLPSDVAEQLPVESARLEILRSDQLKTAQSGARLLRTLDWLLLIITLAVLGLAIYVAGTRRREALRAVGIAFVLVGLLTLLVRGLLGDAVVGGLTDTATTERPVRATWEIATANLHADGLIVIVYGLIILLAAWLAGPAASARWVRRTAAIYLREPRLAYAGLAIVLVLLFWWNPIEDTRRLLPSLILIVLIVLGVEMLRRQVIREFPDHVTRRSPQSAARQIADRMRLGRQRPVEHAEPRASAHEQRLAQLERLAQLRESGALSEDEFAEEKQRVRQSA